MGIIGVNLDFLNDIEINEPTIKAVRFNEDEMYMLKFAAYKGMKFSSYVKQLINDDIKNHCNNTKADNGITKDKIKDIIMEVLREANFVSAAEVEEEIEDEDFEALGDLGISRR